MRYRVELTNGDVHAVGAISNDPVADLGYWVKFDHAVQTEQNIVLNAHHILSVEIIKEK